MKLNQSINALVTGGSSGLGQATTKMLRSQNVNVVIADLNVIKGQKLAQQLNCLFFKTDVSNQQNVKNLFEFIKQKLKNIHIIVNCAGISYIGLFLKKTNVADTNIMLKLLKVNVIGTFNITKYAASMMTLQPMIQNINQKGVIINVSSILATQGTRSSLIYSATKGALLGMTLPLARDLGKHNIRIMTICPGAFETPMTQTDFRPQDREKIFTSTPLSRFGKPQEFAQLIISICQNPFVNGTQWGLDGGMKHL